MNNDRIFSDVYARLTKAGITYIEILEDGLRWQQAGKTLEIKIKEVVLPKNKNRINQ